MVSWLKCSLVGGGIMTSPKQCPYCSARGLERQDENVYLPMAINYTERTYPSFKVKPWVCRHCGLVLFFKVEET